ncbi:MAG TPA: hypothetical protein VK147_08015 [Candidatus Didemnitutus sp.]|nr:hypothetical protein [Candidatus Didemnitutus sp.]
MPDNHREDEFPDWIIIVNLVTGLLWVFISVKFFSYGGLILAAATPVALAVENVALIFFIRSRIARRKVLVLALSYFLVWGTCSIGLVMAS